MREQDKSRAAYAAYARAAACLEAGGELLDEAARLGQEALRLCRDEALEEEIQQLLERLEGRRDI